MEGTEEDRVSKYRKRLTEYAVFVSLPVILALVFVLQNYVFNIWLHLNSAPYLGRFLAVTFGLGLIIYSPSLFFRRRLRFIYLFAVSLLAAFVFIAQYLYFQYSQAFLQVSALEYWWQTPAIAGSIQTLLSPNLLVFLLAIPMVAAALWHVKRKNTIEVYFHWKEKVALFLILLLVAFSGYYLLVREEDKQWGNASQLYKDVFDLNTLVEKVGIINFSLEDVAKFITRNQITQQDQQFLMQFAKDQKSETVKNPKDFGLAKGRNVIFIQVESLESALINQNIGGQEITPNLNRLAAQGLYFSNYYTQVGPGNTADAEFSTLNSLYPLPDDVAFVDYPNNTYHALPQFLKNNGYGTYGLHADVPTFWNRSNVYPNLGYEYQISKNNFIKSRSIGKGPSDVGDEDFLMQSLGKLQTFKQPFFSTLITISSHTPFILPQDLQTLPIPANTNLNFTQQQYLESVHYADKAIGEFIDGLEKTPLYNNSIIFIYGDHGSFTDISNALGNANEFAGLQNSGVPMIILAPGTNLHGVMDEPASHIDLFPTVTNLLGLKTPPGLLGHDMLNDPNPIMTHRNLFSGSINTILAGNLAYESSSDGIFEKGQCFTMPGKIPTAVGNCSQLYSQQSDAVKASDIIIRGNALDLFLSHLSK